MFGKSIVLSGFRDKDLEKEIEMEGGVIVSAISKNTFCLIVKEHGKETTKTKKAKEIGIKIVLKENISDIFLNNILQIIIFFYLLKKSYYE